MQEVPIDIVSIYKGILEGKRIRFPKGTWNTDDGGYDNFRRCFRYLVFSLEMQRHQLLDIDDGFFQKYKLISALFYLFDYSPYAAINFAFPELELKPWEMNKQPPRHWLTSETAISSVRWLINDKLKWTKEDVLKSFKNDILRKNGLSSVHSYFQREVEGDTALGTIMICFPEYNLSDAEKETYLESRKIPSRGDLVKASNTLAKKREQLATEVITDAEKGISNDSLSIKYNVCKQTVRYIVSGKRYSHVTKHILDRYYSVSEAAEMLGLSKGTVRKYCRLGEIKAIKLGYNWRIVKTALQSKISSGPS